MELSEALTLHREMIEGEVELREGKAHDYSTSNDVLSNFAVVAEVCAVFRRHGIPIEIETPVGYCTLLQLLKLTRFLNLLHRTTPPKNESVFDTVRDGRVYWELMRENLIERDHNRAIDPELLENVRELAG